MKNFSNVKKHSTALILFLFVSIFLCAGCGAQDAPNGVSTSIQATTPAPPTPSGSTPSGSTPPPTVPPVPSLAVDKSSLSFTNANLPVLQETVIITNQGPDGQWKGILQPRDVFFSETFSPTNGNWKAGDKVTITVSVVQGEEIGTNDSGSIVFTSSDTSGTSSAPVTVTIAQTAVPIGLTVNTSNVTLQANVSNTDPSTPIQITNTGPAGSGWQVTVTTTPSFALLVDPDGGDNSSFNSGNTLTVSVLTHVGGLPAGTYTGTLAFQAGHEGTLSSPVYVNVTLTIS